ncbi:MAG: thioredoxin family protein [Bacteroidetes bacterium]|nr:thioredoxin family protein [Bacteroidota bacterium]MBS1929529.1 thioredoxin family protein [Bacteroidota bacterium]
MNTLEAYIKSDKPLIVDFSADWCQPCKLMEPVLREVKEKVGDRALVIKMDIDKCPECVSSYNIRAVPTLIIFKDGEILWRKSGVVPAHEILQQLNVHIS